ncbi:MAG: sigma-70 family RNA polymerase sigma factor [Bdellovibrionales bacterium]|nr:sigma-70 family RNA polymerase sigma factor [Bdellovibrionales bacterium]
MKADLELVESVRAGDKAAFSELVRRHQKALLRMVMRFTHDLEVAEEVVQDAFIKAYEKIAGFEGRSSFKSWLYQIAINTAKNTIRSGREQNMGIDNLEVSVQASQEGGLVRRDISKFLQDQIDELPARQKTAVVLRIYEDLSFQEIAEMMECPYDTAKANFRHGLLKIREAFKDNDGLKDWLETAAHGEDVGVGFMGTEAET